MADHDHHEEHKSSHGGGGHGHGGGGGHEGEHEGAPEWLISFADNTALMMGFFCILLAMNMKKPPPPSNGGGGETEGEGAQQAAMLDWALAVREAFNNPVQMNSTNPREAALVERLRERLTRGNAVDPGQKGDHDEVQTIRPSDYVGAGGVVIFGGGSSQITDEGRAAVGEIADRLRGKNNRIEVRGHVSAAEGYRAADHGFDLSYRRAQIVAAELVRLGIEWRQIRLTAAGDNERAVTPEYDAAAAQSNRRVEVVELPELVDAQAAPSPPGGGS